jgi:hypothetical protein
MGAEMKTLDEQIAEQLRDSEAELRNAPSWGKPLPFDDGYDETPIALRMPFKILKDAGVVPHEIEMFREIAACKRALHETASADEARALRQRISELQQAIALRLEKLRISGSL